MVRNNLFEMPKQPSAGPVDWASAEVKALSDLKCSNCSGRGLHWSRQGPIEPCKCVLRAIFRACFRRWQEIQSDHRRNLKGWARTEENFCADFEIVSRRTLNAAEWRIFEMHMLEGRDYKHCCKALAMDKGQFFHAVYRMQQKLGRVFRELQPYGLYPLAEYFCRTRLSVGPTKPKVIAMPRPISAMVPLRKAA